MNEPRLSNKEFLIFTAQAVLISTFLAVALVFVLPGIV